MIKNVFCNGARYLDDDSHEIKSESFRFFGRGVELSMWYVFYCWIIFNNGAKIFHAMKKIEFKAND